MRSRTDPIATSTCPWIHADVAGDFFAYAGIAADLEQIVGRDVDVARRSPKAARAPSAEAQAVYAF